MMSAAQRPKTGKDWSKEEVRRVGTWLATIIGSPFQANLKVKQVTIHKGERDEQRRFNDENIWRAAVHFEPRDVLTLGITIEESVDPVSLFGSEKYVKAAQRLRPGSSVRVKGNIKRIFFRTQLLQSQTRNHENLPRRNRDRLKPAAENHQEKSPTKTMAKQSPPAGPAERNKARSGQRAI